MAKYVIDNRQVDIDFSCDNFVTARILQNCKNLLMTFRGEIPYAREVGFNKQLFDLPIEELNEILLEQIDIMLEAEPRAVAVHAEASLDANHETIITCEVEIN